MPTLADIGKKYNIPSPEEAPSLDDIGRKYGISPPKGRLKEQALASLYESIIGKGLRRTGIVPELAPEEVAPPPEGLLESLTRSGPGLLTDVPWYALFGLPARAAGPVISAASAFGGAGALREALEEETTLKKIATEGATEALVGTALGFAGKGVRALPIKEAFKVPTELTATTGVLAEAGALKRGEAVPTKEELILSGILLGGLKGFNAGLGYGAKKLGTTPEVLKATVEQKATDTGKSQQQVLVDEITEGAKTDIARQSIREIPPTEIPEKGAERGIPQKAQGEEVAPIPPAPVEKILQPEPSKIGSGAKSLQAEAGGAPPKIALETEPVLMKPPQKTLELTRKEIKNLRDRVNKEIRDKEVVKYFQNKIEDSLQATNWLLRAKGHLKKEDLKWALENYEKYDAEIGPEFLAYKEALRLQGKEPTPKPEEPIPAPIAEVKPTEAGEALPPTVGPIEARAIREGFKSAEEIEQAKTARRAETPEEVELEPVPGKRTARLSGVLMQQRNIGTTIEGDLTNGMWLIKKDYIPLDLKERFGKNVFSETASTKTVYSGVPKDVRLAEEVGRTSGGSIFKTKENDIVILNNNAIDYFHKKIKDFNVRISANPEAPVRLYSGGNEIGILMPIQGDISGIKNLLKITKPEPTLSGGRPGVFPEDLADAFRQVEKPLQSGDVKGFNKALNDMVGIWKGLKGFNLPAEAQEQIKGGVSWWHRTLGTPMRVARKNPQFKPVFEAAKQGHIEADVLISKWAPTAKQMENLSGGELDALGKTLFEGTLNEKVFTPEELTAKGLTPKTIEIYQNTRKSLDEMFQEMLRLYKDLGVKEVFEQKELIPVSPPKGYFPLKRFGRWYVEVRDQAGNLVHFETTEESTIGKIARSIKGIKLPQEVRILTNELREKYPADKYKLLPGKMSRAQFEYFQDVDPGTLSLLARYAGVGRDERDHFIRQVTDYLRGRGFGKHFKHREAVPGFSEDVPRVFSAYIVGLSSYISRLRMLTKMKQAAEGIDARAYPDVADYASRYIDYMAKPTGEAGGFRSFLFLWYLGANVKSGALNATQPITTTFPYLTQFANDAVVAKEMAKASGLAILPTARLPKDLADAVVKATNEGTISEQLVYELRGKAKGQLLSSKGIYWDTLRAMSFLFGTVEKFNRRVTFIASYNLAKAGRGTQGMTPEAFAEKAVADTQFLYGRFNRPPLGRGAVGATLLTFKTFMINYLELIRDMPRPQKARMLTTMAGLAGISGIPFADDAKRAFEYVARYLGYPSDVEQTIKDFVTQLTEDPAYADVLLHGVTRLTPFDLGRSIGMGDIIPEASLKGLAGPAGGLIARVPEATEAYQHGRTGRAVEALLPEAARNVLQARRFREEGVRDIKGRLIHKPTTAEVAGKALGFQPSGLSRAREIRETERKTIEFKREQTQIFYDRLARAIFEKDGAERTQVIQDLRDYNSKISPSFRIKIDPATLKRRLQEMRLDEGLAGIRRLPKSARREALERRLTYTP